MQRSGWRRCARASSDRPPKRLGSGAGAAAWLSTSPVDVPVELPAAAGGRRWCGGYPPPPQAVMPCIEATHRERSRSKCIFRSSPVGFEPASGGAGVQLTRPAPPVLGRRNGRLFAPGSRSPTAVRVDARPWPSGCPTAGCRRVAGKCPGSVGTRSGWWWSDDHLQRQGYPRHRLRGRWHPDWTRPPAHVACLCGSRVSAHVRVEPAGGYGAQPPR